MPPGTKPIFSVTAPLTLVPVQHFEGTRIAEHVFAFYGESHAVGNGIDWEFNPGTWHWGHDLNRFGFLALYETNRSAEFAHDAIALILDWIRKNGTTSRHGSPYAWGNLLNVAIRAENWWRFMQSAITEGHFDPNTPEFDIISNVTTRHAHITLREIRKRGFADNWTIIGLRSAFFILHAMADLPHRQRLLSIAQGYLEQAINQQILPDGAQQELCPHYHWVALELLTSIATLGREARQSPSKRLVTVIAEMARLLGALMSPSGTIVALGDSDPDYGPRISAFLQTLEKTDRASPSIMSNDEPEIATFPYAGLVSVRHRQSDSLFVFDGGPFGTAHQHEDALSFWMSAFGRDLLVDPGRYLYEKGSGTFYDYLCSTAAHSTIRIDGHDQNARAKRATWRRLAPGEPNVIAGNGFITVSATYAAGYGPKHIAVRHRRTIKITEHGTAIEIQDDVLGEGTHHIEQTWQVSPGPWTLAGSAFQAIRENVTLDIACHPRPALSYRVACGERRPFRGWYSPSLNKIEPSPALIVEGPLTLPAMLVTKIRATRSQKVENESDGN